jgi:hypothetical protein
VAARRRRVLGGLGVHDAAERRREPGDPRGRKLRQLDYDRNKFNLTEVTNENKLTVGKGLHEEVAAHLKGALGIVVGRSRGCRRRRKRPPRHR